MPVKKKTVAKRTSLPKGKTRKAPRRAIAQAQLVNLISEDTGYSQADVRHVLASLDIVVSQQIANCEKVKIGQLVQLEAKVKPARKARMGRNPRTGEAVKIAAKPAGVAVKARVLTRAKHSAPTLAKLKKVIG